MRPLFVCLSFSFLAHLYSSTLISRLFPILLTLLTFLPCCNHVFLFNYLFYCLPMHPLSLVFHCRSSHTSTLSLLPYLLYTPSLSSLHSFPVFIMSSYLIIYLTIKLCILYRVSFILVSRTPPLTSPVSSLCPLTLFLTCRPCLLFNFLSYYLIRHPLSRVFHPRSSHTSTLISRLFPMPHHTVPYLPSLPGSPFLRGHLSSVFCPN